MPALDFQEIAIPQAGPDRDQFELFAREFLDQEGFTIISGPDRGADDGRDLIVKEVRQGPGGTNEVSWLVSCKHKAHSGSSVTPSDELNIRDRIETHGCTGFISFYSTLPSSGLGTILDGLRPKYGLLLYDREVIERKLLENRRGRQLAARFMPVSFQKWVTTSQYALPTTIVDPQREQTFFFLSNPRSDLSSALGAATEQGRLVFVVIFDPAHPTRSKLNYALGYFMEYQTTKRLVEEHFVAVVGPSSDPQLSRLVPDDDPLEACLWVVLNSSGNILRRESLYPAPDEGLKRVREVIAEFTP
jgi:hypothetical protein